MHNYVAKFSPEIARNHICQQTAVISPARAATVVTHAWTKLHAQITAESPASMNDVCAWPLPEATTTTVHNLHHYE